MERQNGATERPQVQCAERERLRDQFLAAVRELAEFQKQQTQAVVDHDDDFARFDDLIQLARLVKDNAKYALLAHLADHGCDRPSQDEKGE